MSIVRAIDPPRTVDPHYRQAERIATLEKRIALLERPTTSKFVRTFSAVSSGVLLDAFDGQAFTAVRLTVTGNTATTASNTFLRIKPNGLSTMQTAAIAQRSYTNVAPTYTPAADAIYGGAYGLSPGIVICETDWGTASNNIWADGILSLQTGRVRGWLGNFGNSDAVTDGNQRLSGRIHSLWGDLTTVVSSLRWSVDAGTFTGRISVELIP